MNDTEFKYKISDMLPGIRKVFEENPYCVFGISSMSALQGIFDQRDINYWIFLVTALDSKKSTYDLKDVELPKRDTESLIKAYGHFNNLKERWLWFKSDTYAFTWNNRLLFHYINSSSFSNDQLLASLKIGFVICRRFIMSFIIMYLRARNICFQEKSNIV